MASRLVELGHFKPDAVIIDHTGGMARVYGSIPGYSPGTRFTSRAELAAAGIHPPGQAGISGGADGADSIVLSGGYTDDTDLGTEVIYTGQGGRHPGTQRQVSDQELTRGNRGLVRSHLEGHPIRVTRGAGGDPRFSPASGYRYDGLYEVVDYWCDVGRSGFRVWQFQLVKLVDDLPSDDVETAPGISRRTVTVSRQVRNAVVAQEVKDLHNNRCQFCGVQLMTPVGPYSQAAHIRPVGRPHNGPDIRANLLCLCPNDHVLFDNGAVYVQDDDTVVYAAEDHPARPLRLVPKHRPAVAHFEYHRRLYGHPDSLS